MQNGSLISLFKTLGTFLLSPLNVVWQYNQTFIVDMYETLPRDRHVELRLKLVTRDFRYKAIQSRIERVKAW